MLHSINVLFSVSSQMGKAIFVVSAGHFELSSSLPQCLTGTLLISSIRTGAPPILLADAAFLKTLIDRLWIVGKEADDDSLSKSGFVYRHCHFIFIVFLPMVAFRDDATLSLEPTHAHLLYLITVISISIFFLESVVIC